jgi:hypothetical protein
LRVAGVAPSGVDIRRPKAEAIAKALDFAATAQVQSLAVALGEKMRTENGVRDAVTALESIVR